MKGLPDRHIVEKQKEVATEGAVVRMKLVGANAAPRVIGAEEQPGKVHYFIGSDPAKWQTNVPTYAKVKYQGVYHGVDLVYYGNQGRLEYDFVVAPGIDPNKIRLKLLGRGKLRVNEKGDLLLGSGGEQVRFEKPVVYQELAGDKKQVEGSYVLASANRVGFQLGEYDHSQPLVIDPVLSYSTYLGSNIDDGVDIAVDASGNAYVTGFTYSTDFPTVNALQPALGSPNNISNAFVSKIDASGSALVYSTYLGGSGNGLNGDFGFGIAVDASGNAYVTGFTHSTNFPTANALQSIFGGGGTDAFVTKINPSGSELVYSTYLGGSNRDSGSRIAVDASGNAYVTGFTQSTNFPTASALQPALGGPGGSAFVTKINASGSALVYSTYFGGSGSGLNGDFGVGIAVDASENAYVTGGTYSTNFPTVNALQPTLGGFLNAFVTKINQSGSALVYSTYLGGSIGEYGNCVAVDTSGNAYVTGFTHSTNFPTANALQSTFGGGDTDAFVTKINKSGSALVYSTYLGGSKADSGNCIAADTSGNAYITGSTQSTDFPTVHALQPALAGPAVSAFVTKINASGSALVYSTYLGGSGGDNSNGIAVDASGNAYVTGGTQSTNFPTASALQSTLRGAENIFVAKISSDNIPPTTTAIPSPGPNGNGWNDTSVTVELNVADNPGGSGVKQIQYALSGAENIGLQTEAGNVASVTISTEGITTLTYFAKDNAGNQEPSKTLTVRIDETPPVISGLPVRGCTIWPPNHKLVQVATVTALDGLSGPAPSSFSVAGTSNDPADGQIAITSGPSQFLVQLRADKDQVYTLTATVSDLAGNVANAQATCIVPHDQRK
jgi:hypothetical protein